MIDIKLTGVNKVRKLLASGEFKTFYYYRATSRSLPDDPGTPEFLKAYLEAQEEARENVKSTNRNRGTLKELIQRYMESPSYRDVSPRTRQDYQRQIIKIEDAFGDMRIEVLNDHRIRADFLDWRDMLAKTSKKQADYAITVLGLILAWSMDRGLIAHNYAARPGKLYRSERAAIVWSYQDVEAFLVKAPLGLQLALILARDTGQRQGDLLKLTWAAYDGFYIRLSQSKTGARVEVPVTLELKAQLDGAKARRSEQALDATTILTRPDGRPWRVDHFRHAWRDVTLAAGIDGKRFQDLRGTAVTALADAGCTALEIASITGHSPKSVEAILEHYLARSRARADNAIVKLENAKRTKVANRAANCRKSGKV
jgi:integrase